MVETLLHEMIHAYLFVTDGNDDHDGHGSAFHEHMYRINKETGTKISVYHNFHDEVSTENQESKPLGSVLIIIPFQAFKLSRMYDFAFPNQGSSV